MHDVSPSVKLPAWIDCVRAVEEGAATPLQRFIAANEPAADALRDEFRAELSAVLASAQPRQPSKAGSWCRLSESNG